MAGTRKVNNLQTLLSSLAERTDGDNVKVGTLIAAVGRRSYGPVLLLLGFIAVSPITIIPGTSWLVALMTVLFAGQMMLGLERPWLPKRATDFEFPRKYLVNGVDACMPYARWIDTLLKPRLTFLTAAPFAQIVAAACVIAALVTFPLGLVPFGPVLPGLAIMVLGLGITARDGFALILAGGCLGGAVYLLWQFVPGLLS
jgi:hypothetical protein